jgi:hypothetical protein
VNVTVGSMAAPSLAEMMWMFKVLQSVVPYPGCVRTPKLVVTRNKVVHGALVLHGHVLFGLLMDGLARLVGKEPRQVPARRPIWSINHCQAVGVVGNLTNFRQN